MHEKWNSSLYMLIKEKLIIIDINKKELPERKIYELSLWCHPILMNEKQIWKAKCLPEYKRHMDFYSDID